MRFIPMSLSGMALIVSLLFASVCSSHADTIIDTVRIRAVGDVPTTEAKERILKRMLPEDVIASGVSDWKFTAEGRFRITIRRDGKDVEVKDGIELSKIEFRAGDYIRIRNYKNQPETALLTQTLFEAFEQTGIVSVALLNQIVAEKLYFQGWQEKRNELKSRLTEDEFLGEELSRLCSRFGQKQVEVALREMRLKALRQIDEIDLMHQKVKNFK